MCVDSAVHTAKARTNIEPAAHHASAGACESHDAITVASMPPRRTFGVTVTGRRLPAQFRQPELRKQAMSMTGKFSLGLLGACLAVMLASPQAATQTAQQGEARDAAIRRCIAEAIPGGGGPIAGYAAGGRVQGLHG